MWLFWEFERIYVTSYQGTYGIWKTRLLLHESKVWLEWELNAKLLSENLQLVKDMLHNAVE
jgi:hypothetical protein